MKKLAIITTHPIQYNAPLFRLLTERNSIELKVFYTWGQTASGNKFDPGFGKSINWDIPLLEGYDYEFVENTSTKPGSHHFKGIVNPTLIAILTQFQPTAILVFGWNFQSHLQVMRYFKGKTPIFFRGDSTLLDETKGYSLKKFLRRIVLKRVYQYVDICFYVGSANKAYYLKHGVTEQQLVYAPHAIDNQRFAESNAEYEEKTYNWKKTLGVDKATCIFVFAGKLEAKKNPLLLLETFTKIQDPGIRLIIIGNGPLETVLKERSVIDDRVILLPFQNQQQMPLVYRLGDIFVLPSKGPGETWGLAINEAMACYRPVIVSDKCGAAKDVVDEHTGWIFPHDQPVALLQIMQYIIFNKRKLQIMGKAANEKIASFNYEVIAASIESNLLRTKIISDLV